MRPAARIAALIDLMSEIEEGIAAGGAPADITVANFFKARRYAGSKDRRFISDTAYALLRSRALLLWALEACTIPVTGRSLVLAHLALNAPENISAFSSEEAYGPNPLSADEQSLFDDLCGLELSSAPAEQKLNLPVWAVMGFKERYGKNYKDAAASLNTQAPLDLRINSLAGRVKKIQQLPEFIEFERTPWSPLGIRFPQNVALGGLAAYKRGQVEVQDEAAQIASHLVAARPGMDVLDLCAGAGGKSLAVAALMQNKGRITACDIVAGRLKECARRAKRAGVSIIDTRQLDIDPELRGRDLNDQLHNNDRVFVDVPCSGTGTWRRSPDQRWRFDSERLNELNAVQRSLLSEGAQMVRTGGRLIYMTCSVLPCENEQIISDFVGSNTEWKLIDYRGIWKDALGSKPAETLSTIPEALMLSPETHHTDGFFVAILTKG